MKPYLVAALALLTLFPYSARAHCDTLDGPLLDTARAALDTGEVAPVLAWVKPAGEKEVRAAFQDALKQRKAKPASREATDRRFFETLVRVHRTGEGASYTGLKPAGQGVTEGLRAADRGIAAGDGAEAEAMLVESVRSGLRTRFAALQAQTRPGKDVEAGRRWVEAYVTYVHYVEGLEAAAGAAGGHHEGEASAHAEKAAGEHHEHAVAKEHHEH